MSHRLLTFAVFVSLALQSRSGSAGEIAFQPLTGNWGVATHVHDISDDGEIVVGDMLGNSGSEAVFWNMPEGTHTTIGKGVAVGVSADGNTIVGNALVSQDAFRWTAFDGATALPYLPGAALMTANAISGDGKVAVGSADYHYGVAWEGADDPWQYSDGSPDEDSTYIAAVSFDGRTAVGGVGEAIAIWMGGRGASPLKFDLPDSSGPSRANDVTADGAFVVGGSGSHAFSWSSAKGIEDLGTLQGYRTMANGTSADGRVIVGHAWSSTFPYGEATIRGPSGNWRTLEEVLAAHGQASEWQLWSAEAISADGKTIIGNGLNPQGVQSGWAVTLPEPPTWLISTTGLALLALRGKFRRDVRAGRRCRMLNSS